MLGTGSLANGTTSITDWVPGAGVLTPMVGRNVWVTITSSTHIGQGYRTKVTSEGASLGLRGADAMRIPTWVLDQWARRPPEYSPIKRERAAGRSAVGLAAVSSDCCITPHLLI